MEKTDSWTSDPTASRFLPITSVPRSRLEDYAEKYQETFALDRSEGILEVRLCTNGGPGGRSGWFEVWSQVWLDIGNDPENEVIIITGTGVRWIDMVDAIKADGPETT